ncbi:hypothetical protein PCANC_27331 [Puccinia coronata f. sp. avenae]|uniref:Uncharacterized protein n=1 Tax=Puccinia coronata f. sp. avenae TaxID=200324 RepID=A0A2N5S801_9BASI|nr:hypothetical protein PCANC_27331 [Puccinia coronata f. sp. avenae]
MLLVYSSSIVVALMIMSRPVIGADATPFLCSGNYPVPLCSQTTEAYNPTAPVLVSAPKACSYGGYQYNCCPVFQYNDPDPNRCCAADFPGLQGIQPGEPRNVDGQAFSYCQRLSSSH